MTVMKTEATLIREYQLRAHSRGEHDDQPNGFCEACELTKLAASLGVANYTPYIPRYLRRKHR